MILPYSDHPCFDKIVNGITKAAFQHEYATTLLPTNYNPDIEIKYLELLRTKKIDGLIITSRANHWDSILAYQEYGPVIACEDTGDIDVPCAFNDRKTAYAESFRYLKSRGHENIALRVSEKLIGARARLIKLRPIKLSAEGWKTAICCPDATI